MRFSWAETVLCSFPLCPARSVSARDDKGTQNITARTVNDEIKILILSLIEHQIANSMPTQKKRRVATSL